MAPGARKGAALPIGAMAEAQLRGAWRTARAHTVLSLKDWMYLAASTPDTIRGAPDLPVSGETEIGANLRDGTYALPGGVVTILPGVPPWSVRAPSTEWLESASSFAWLRHLAAVDEPAMADHVRWLISTWLATYGRWDAVAWRPHVTARRLVSWFAHANLILHGADHTWRGAFLASLARQARYLHTSAASAAEGCPRLIAAIGLTVSGLCLTGGAGRITRGLALLERELALQIRGDGLHVSRNPELTLEILLDLILLRGLLRQMKRPVPDLLQETFQRIKPALRMLRLGDGRLAQFHGGTEGAPVALARGLSEADTRAFSAREPMGFRRLAAGNTTLIVDAGTPPPAAFSANTHAGCLSFELSSARHRIVVNCGATMLQGTEWHQALRQTAAHSTLTLGDESSCVFLNGVAARVLGQRVLHGPRDVAVAQQKTSQGIWLAAAHDGYRARTGWSHRRELYLSTDGTDLRGEDRLFAEPGENAPIENLPFAVRFHLHPDVRVSLSHDRSWTLLMAPDGLGWAFRAKGGALALEESTYVPGGAERRRSEQIVLRGHTGANGARVKWALTRAAGRS